jgi:hypothetical protein
MLRKIVRAIKRGGDNIDWVHNEDLRAYVRGLLSPAFQLEPKIAGVSLEVVLVLVKKRKPEDLEQAKKMATPLVEAWMFQQFAANTRGHVAVGTDGKHTIPVSTSGLKWGGIIPADILATLTADDGPGLDDPLLAAAEAAAPLPGE